MTAPEEPTPSRSRPTYGLPGPTAPVQGDGASADAPRPEYGRPDHGSLDYGRPDAVPGAGGPGGLPAWGSPAPAAPAPVPTADPYGSGGAHAAPPAAPTKRRGLVPLILGLVLLLLVGPGLIIGGIIGTAGGAASQISDPIAFEGGQMQTPIEPMEMVIVYVPEAVADQTECLGEGVVPGSIVSQETQGTVVLGDGNTYRQQVSFSSTQSTTLTVTCSGPDGGPLQYVGPMNSLWMVAPLFIGVGLGILAGTIGLVLTIVGIVQRRRSARA